METAELDNKWANDNEVVFSREFGDFIHAHESKVYLWRKSGAGPKFQSSSYGPVYYKVGDVQDWLAKHWLGPKECCPRPTRLYGPTEYPQILCLSFRQLIKSIVKPHAYRVGRGWLVPHDSLPQWRDLLMLVGLENHDLPRV